MGAVNSCCIPRRSCDCEMGTTTSTPKPKGHRRNLSATFNLSLIEESSAPKNLVNINTASEEELMTLPGINRNIAKNIIDYRNHIGGFRRVEDLALASGVGAVKLAMIQNEIYVIPPAGDDLNQDKLENPTPQNNSGSESNLVVNVNSANIFSLLRVKGIGMAIAKNIVAYRDKHGKFKSIDELLRVKGIGPANIGTMRPYLSVEDKPQPSSKSPETKKHNQSNGKIANKTSSHDGLAQDYVLRSTTSLENLLEILGPLAKVPERPKVEKVVLKHKNQRVFRLATWNLERFSLEKASNPGVKDVICMTILENGLGLVAVQELADRDALQEICNELNSPTLPNVKKWSGKRGHWVCEVSEATGRMFQSTEYHGFLYDKSQNIELLRSTLIEKAPGKAKAFTRMPFVGIFKVNRKFDCVLVSVHLKATGLENEDKARTEKEADKVQDIIKAVKQEIKDEKDIMILGDFNLNPDAKAFDDLRLEGYKNCIPADVYTNISNNNASGSMSYDNIWISKETQQVYTDVNGVIREGLSSTWIPNGWSWGGVVSDHCPVYAQFYTNKDLDNGDISADVKFIVGQAPPPT